MVPPRSTGHLSGNWSPPLCTRPRPLFRPHPRNVPQTGRDTPLAPIHVSSLPPHSPQPSCPPRPLDMAPITGRDTRSAGRMPRIVVAAPLPAAAVSPPPPPECVPDAAPHYTCLADAQHRRCRPLRHRRRVPPPPAECAPDEARHSNCWTCAMQRHCRPPSFPNRGSVGTAPKQRQNAAQTGRVAGSSRERTPTSTATTKDSAISRLILARSRGGDDGALSRPSEEGWWQGREAWAGPPRQWRPQLRCQSDRKRRRHSTWRKP